jgi:hypothetical protein
MLRFVRVNNHFSDTLSVRLSPFPPRPLFPPGLSGFRTKSARKPFSKVLPHRTRSYGASLQGTRDNP